MTVRLDAYGLHVADCDCIRCQCGYGPTDGDRRRAREAAEAAARRRGTDHPRTGLKRGHWPRVEVVPPMPPPLTAEQRAVLAADLAAAKRRWGRA